MKGPHMERQAAVACGGSGGDLCGAKRTRACRLLHSMVLTAACLSAAIAQEPTPPPPSPGPALRQVGSGGDCNGEAWISSSGACRIFAAQEIPAITVGLFDHAGAPCCGDAVTTVEVTLRRARAGRAERIPLAGFVVRDSSASSAPDATMTLQFSGLRPTNAGAGAFNLTFSAFYRGTPLEYHTPLHILPDALQLQSTFSPRQRFLVHEVMPALRVSMVGRGARMEDDTELRVNARLFNKGDMADITGASLDGATSIVFDRQGIAVFSDLSVKRRAGAGFHVVFYVEGSEKRCVSGVTSATCADWRNRRGPTGGLGGYWLETLSPNFTMFPDHLRLSTTSVSMSSLVRIDAAVPTHTISLHDSRFPHEAIADIVANDGFHFTVQLESESESYPITGSHLEGSKAVPVKGGTANFKDLIMRNVTGPAFRLRFEASWNEFCYSGDRDPACNGTCCLLTPSFPIYPFSMRVSPATVPDIVVGDQIANFTADFVDYRGSRLVGVDSNLWAPAGLNFRVSLAVYHRAAQTAGKLVGGDIAAKVLRGRAFFMSPGIQNLAGRHISFKFQEVSSGLQVDVVTFAIYPDAFNLSTPISPRQVAGRTILLDLPIFDNDGRLLTSVRSADGFWVRANVSKFKNGKWVPCSCLSQDEVLVEDGIASFTRLSVTSVGSFMLNFTLPRGKHSILSFLTTGFDVFAAAIAVSNSSLAPEYTLDDVLGNVTVILQDFHGNFMPDVDKEFDRVNVSVRVVVGNSVLENQLAGVTERIFDKGRALFSGLSVPSLTGTGFQLQFVLQGADATLTAKTDQFSVVPSGLILNETIPHGRSGMSLPAMAVTLTNSSGLFVPQLILPDPKNAIEISVDFLSTRYLGCSQYRPDPNGILQANWSQCARKSALANASFFYVSQTLNGDPTCGFGGVFSEGCAGDMCWHNVSLDQSECATAGLNCSRGARDVCNASHGTRFFVLENSSPLLEGTLRVRSLGGKAVFSDIRIPTFYGKAACLLLFTNHVGRVKLLEATYMFDLDPVKIVLLGPPLPALLEQPSFENLTVALTDQNDADLMPLYMFEPYVIIATLMHHGVEKSSNVYIHGKTAIETMKPEVSFAFALMHTGGRNLAIRFSSMNARTPLVTTTTPFGLLPSSIEIESQQLGGEEGSALDEVIVSCRDDRRQTITGIEEKDDLLVAVTVYRNQSVVGVCSSTVSNACLQGTTLQKVSNGVATFKDLIIVGIVGRTFRYKFTLKGATGLEVMSPSFVVYPGVLAITDGQTNFDGMPVYINQAIGVYSIGLRPKFSGQDLKGVDDINDFNITASLFKRGQDISEYLSGKRSILASYNSSHGAHALFTDLEVLAAGADMILLFAFSDPFVASSVAVSTNTFNTVPYALRIEERCYNGNPVASTAIEHHSFGLDCTGSESVPSELGRFGFLSGYYYLRSNQYVGPLLWSVRGRARVPPISVVAVDLFAASQVTIQESDQYRIGVILSVNDQDRTRHVLGNTSVLIVNGSATFDDLIIEAFDQYEDSPCTAVLKFFFQGALCSDVWCANVTLEIRPALVPTPAELGSHPLFPATQYVYGAIKLEGLSSSEFQAHINTTQAFREAVIRCANVGQHGVDDVLITNVSGTSRRLLQSMDFSIVDFQVASRTYAAATAIMSAMTDVLRSQVPFSALRKCSEPEKVRFKICNSSVELQQPLARRVILDAK